MFKRFIFADMVLSLSTTSVHADAFEAGNKAFDKGDVAKAIKKWTASNRPEAAYRMGQIAEQGQVPNCDLNCALKWYQKSVDGDYIPALTPIGALYWNDGQKDKGLAVFQFAARWNEPNARSLLEQMDQEVPDPDLWKNHLRQQEYLRAQAQLAEVERQQAMAAYAPALGQIFGCMIAGAACGYQPPPPVYMQSPQPAPPRATSGSRAPTRLCPDGSYVVGERCYLAPDGSYHGGQPRMAPDGSYVAGEPRLAPNGQYLGGYGPTRLCPNGSYVRGSRCRLMPDGSYVGE